METGRLTVYLKSGIVLACQVKREEYEQLVNMKKAINWITALDGEEFVFDPEAIEVVSFAPGGNDEE